MKKVYTLLFLCLTVSVFAQERVLVKQSVRPPSTKQVAPANATHRTAVACTADTILYPYLKELTFTAPNDSFFLDAMVGNVRTAAQGYTASSAISVKGVQFWAAAYSTEPTYIQTLPVVVSLWSVDAQFMPVTELATVTVNVTGAYDFYEAVFASPVTVSSNYAVSVRCSPNDTLAVVTNNAGNSWSPDYGENLAWRKFGSGVWNTTEGFFGQDMEYMIFPIVEQAIVANYTTDGAACIGTPENFTVTSTGLLNNRMYNLWTFDQFFGFNATDSTHKWDFADGTPIQAGTTQSHTFNTAGTYNVKLTTEKKGYYNSCVDAKTTAVVVSNCSSMPVVISSFTGKRIGNSAVLGWTVATEINVREYQVERSANGSAFVPVGKVTAANSRSYQFTDAAPLQHGYYRLRIVDNDGSISYSAVVVLKSGSHLNLKPFVQGGQLLLNVEAAAAGKAEVVIYNSNGSAVVRKAYTLQAGQNSLIIDAVLASGVYVAQLQSNGVVISERFVK